MPPKQKRNVFFGALIVAVLALVLVVLMGSSKDQPTIETVTTTRALVAIDHGKFVPSTVKIKIGATVVWAISDSDAGTYQIVSSDSQLSNLSSSRLSGHGTYKYRFDQTGTFAYHDGLNPSMSGTIIVEP